MHELVKNAEEKMKKSVSSLEHEYASIRAGRANAAVLDKVTVDYYGVPTPIQQVGSISVAEARVLVITPWDKSLLKDIEKAIQASDIGINPSNDGNVIRIAFPQLTEERRKEITKNIAKTGESSKVAVRNIRREANDKLKLMKKDGDVSEDEIKDLEELVQKVTDKYVKIIDEMTKAKEQEILTV